MSVSVLFQEDAAQGLDTLHRAAREAWIYALPLVEIAQVRARMLGAGLVAGRFFAQRRLTRPQDRWVTTPNVDTLYANTFIDLRAGPAVVTVPRLGERYGSLALMDMYSDNFAVLGSRTIGQDGGTFLLAGPTGSAPAGAIRAATPWVWALARVVVNGPEDVAAAQAVLRGFTCEMTPAAEAGAGDWAPGADRMGPWQDWLRAAHALLIENPPPATDRRILDVMAPLGLGERDFDPTAFSAAEAAAIENGFDEARALAQSGGFGGRRAGDWIYPATNIGNFFQDYLTRARIAVRGLAALPMAEATYLSAIPPEGKAFDGPGPWRLRMPLGTLPPVAAFWSLTLYRVEPNGALFLAENPIDRYAIGDRTPGIVPAEMGGLDIWISRTDPGEARRSNWLPAPAEGPFALVLRAYLPERTMLAQTYVPPAVERIDR